MINGIGILDFAKMKEPLFFGDSGGSRFKGVPIDFGDYIIRVYLFRSAARRNELANFNPNVEIAASGRQKGAPDAKVAGMY